MLDTLLSFFYKYFWAICSSVWGKEVTKPPDKSSAKTSRSTHTSKRSENEQMTRWEVRGLLVLCDGFRRAVGLVAVSCCANLQSSSRAACRYEASNVPVKEERGAEEGLEP